MMAERTWAQVLDEFERRIVETEAALDADDILNDALTKPFTPPENLGPLPVELRERAIDIVRRQAETQQRIGVTVEAVRNQVAKTTRQLGDSRKAALLSEGPTPRYFDSKI